MRPTKPKKFLSEREVKARDALMECVRRSIARNRLSCDQILDSGRPLNSAERARILRGEYDWFSFRRAMLLSDAVGVDDMDFFRAALGHADFLEATPAPALEPA